MYIVNSKFTDTINSIILKKIRKMKSTITVSIDSKVLENFYDTTYKQGVVKSAIIQELILEYLENGLRSNPQPRTRKQHHLSKMRVAKEWMNNINPRV